ncbi:EpsG family protein [Ruminococcus flavefaciens]|uniref:EpsG family protein n=1 Tax=Ruminococcus flavefaciens TaxID=1265 RepID=A0A1M7J545_RUMFL|nr:EpsG family protein [Ruminococcus flavefaciens]MCR4796205.1 EpsG family protein [Ruminococcus sp.]SHM47983.1 EpsG family protein [Ruminococcus flavefaciens]
MLFYWILLFVVFILTFAGHCINNKKFKKTIVIVLFFIMFVLSAFRVNIGVDYAGYQRIYHVYESGWGSTFASEPLFTLLNMFAVKLHLGFYFVIAVTALLTLLPICYIAYKENAPLLMGVYYLFLYSMSYSLVRQFIAMSFLLLSTYLYIKGRNVKAQVIFALLAAGFHISAIAFIGVLFLSRFSRIDLKYALICCFLLVVVFGLLKGKVIGIFISLLNNTKYSRYFSNESTHNHTIRTSSGLGVILRYMVYFCYLITANFTIKDKKSIRVFNFMFVAFLLSDLLAMNVEIMIRFRILLYVVLLIPVFQFKRIHDKEVGGYLVKLGMVMMPIMYLIVMKYQSDIVGWKNVPYQSWLIN